MRCLVIYTYSYRMKRRYACDDRTSTNVQNHAGVPEEGQRENQVTRACHTYAHPSHLPYRLNSSSVHSCTFLGSSCLSLPFPFPIAVPVSARDLPAIDVPSPVAVSGLAMGDCRPWCMPNCERAVVELPAPTLGRREA
jgi:hypothetical protein